MFIRKTALYLILGLAVNGGVFAGDTVSSSEGLIAIPSPPMEQDGLIEVPAGPIDDSVVINLEPKTDDGMMSEEDRIIQTALPTQMAGIESQSGIVESLNDFTGHPDLQELNQDEVLVLDNLATGNSKGLLKLKKASK